MPPKKGTVRAGQGLQKLLSEEPSQLLLYAVEQAQSKAGHMKLRRVLKHLKKRHEAIGWVHVSDILNDCDRYLAARFLGYQFKEEISIRLERIFENGHMMHIRWQNYFLSLPPEYQVSISHIIQTWPIIGEADLTVIHPTLGRIVVELKSINDNGFKATKGGARVGHIAQVSHYAHLLSLMDDKTEPWTAQIWYENKNDQDMRTFDPVVQSKVVDERLERALEVAAMASKGQLPKPCETDCEYDGRVGNVKLDEARIETMKAWFDKEAA